MQQNENERFWTKYQKSENHNNRRLVRWSHEEITGSFQESVQNCWKESNQERLGRWLLNTNIPLVWIFRKIIQTRFQLIALFAKTLTGKTVSIKVEAGEAIKDVKARITEKEGIPPEQQRLILGRQQLHDGKTIND